MFPKGFLGTRADLLMDIVLVALIAVVPIVIYNWRLARSKQFSRHKAMQIALIIVLAVVVGIFEYDLSSQGGIFKATAASSFAGTATLNFWIRFHSFFAETTVLIWLVLITVSLMKFPRPPAPNAFSGIHRFFGRIGMVWMLTTGITSIPVYYYGFAR